MPRKNKKTINAILATTLLLAVVPFNCFAVTTQEISTSLSIGSTEPPPPQTYGANKLINPGFEQAGDSRRQAYGWQTFQLGYKRVAAHHSGSWGIRLDNTDFSQMSGAYQRIDLNQTELKPVFIGGYVKGKNIIGSPGGYFGASLYVEIHLKDGSIAYWNSLPNYGTFAWRWIGFNTGTLPQVNQPINHIFVVPILAQATGRAFFDDITAVEITPNQSAVTLMFDDGEVSTYTQAKPVLDKFSFAASAAIVTGWVGASDVMSWAQIQELQNSSGWEIVSHSVNHQDMSTLDNTVINRELANSKKVLEKHGLTIQNFALPYGAYNDYIMAQGAKRYSSVRAYEQGVNPQGAFPYEVKIRGIMKTTTLEEVATWLLEAKENNKWLVLVFHGINNEDVSDYYTTPEKFQEIIDAVAKSQLSVMTYNQGLEAFGFKK